MTPEKQKKKNTFLIVGVSIAVVLLLIVLFIIGFYYYNKHNFYQKLLAEGQFIQENNPFDYERGNNSSELYE